MFWGAQPTGGVRRVLMTKRAHLLAAGWRHTLLVPASQGEAQLHCGGVPLPGSGGYRFALNRRRAAALMVQAAPDLIEAADPYVLGWSALDAARRLGVPAIAFCHSHLPALAARLLGGTPRGRRAGLAWRVAQRYLLRLYAHYDLVLAPSRLLAEQLRGWGLAQAQVQPLGVDCQVFRPEARDPAWAGQLKKVLALAPDTRLLLYCGRFATEKRLPLLARALDLLGPGHALLCVGGGPCPPPPGPRLRLLPPEPDARRLARLMASCDAFVHAGDQESFGLSALEAMACGTPVVLAAQGGLGELGSGVAGLVASTQPAFWAEAMHRALHPDDADEVQRALRRARALDWTAVMAQMMRRYRRLLGVGDGGATPRDQPLSSGRSASAAAYSFRRL
ncbi:glycosyltransferase [Pelomonas sp. CA6]|uniref:glycosyltransferase n=1 Tax=Pelomonas sp. CA6 TaxID=2907999 RepID=UPI001F4C397E|nr:glycosyltransferase [Pelomonas sp. CA6]MCH7345201.1 glycosyltransferase [Pelomonas sp. CA6]